MRARGTFDRLEVLRNEPRFWRDGIAAAESEAGRGGRTRLQAAQALDVADWLPNDLLTKLDRCLMAHGVEGRTPFLDSGVSAAAFRLPDALKVRDNQGKYLLREWLSRHFPASEPFRPKQGFTVPIGAWIERKADVLGPLVARQAGVAEICKPGRVEQIFRHASDKKSGAAAWHLLFYALWHRRHVEGVAAEGDVFSYLG
jgi:asparagine synthase (glutamine-hydrolysing)